MQVASDLLTMALEGLIHALILIGALTGAVIWQAKRSSKEDPRDTLVKQMNEEMGEMAKAVQEQGERIAFLEGGSNGKPPRH